MPNQKLVEILRSLSDAQCVKLRQFIESPYHNDRFNKTKITQLGDHLLDAIGASDAELPAKSVLNNIFFPDHPYKEKEKNPIDSLASDLLSLVRRFILFEDLLLEHDKRQEQLAMARFYRKNNLENRFLATVAQFRKLQNKVDYKDEQYYHLLFTMEQEIAIFQTIYNTYADDSNLIAANQALDNYFAISKSEFATHLRFQKLLASVENDQSLLLSDYLFSVLEDYQELHNPLTILYQLIFGLLDEPENEELFAALSQAVERYEAEIAPRKFRNIMAYFRNISGRRTQLRLSGNELFEQLFPLYRAHLENGYFHVLDTQQILPGSLKVLVNLAIKARQEEWAERLLETYPPSRMTGTKYPNEAHSLCAAELHFHQGNLTEAQDKLVYRNFENINYSILADILLLKIYFVTKNELLNSRAAALSQKVRRSKITPAHKKQYLNFLKLLGQVEKLRWKNSPKSKLRVKQRLQEVTPLIERAWLLQIVDEV
ncbi:MAG: hypothetical protein AAFP77_07610 [Bacteroidota bacterium]